MRVGFQKSSKTKISNSREKQNPQLQRKKQSSIDIKNEQSQRA